MSAAPVPAVQDPCTALQLTIKDLEWTGNELKKENAMLEEELTRVNSQDHHIQASWDYALSLRRGEELERRRHQLGQQLAALRRTHAELQQVFLPPPLLCPDLRGVCTRRLRHFRRRNAPWTRT